MQIRIRIRKFKIPVLGIQIQNNENNAYKIPDIRYPIPLDYYNIRVKSEPNHWKGLYVQEVHRESKYILNRNLFKIRIMGMIIILYILHKI